MLRLAVLLLVLVAFAVAYVLRTAGVAVTRHRWPAVAEGIRRWWAWLPVAAACLALMWFNLVIGLVATAVLAVILLRADATGSPFRPRR